MKPRYFYCIPSLLGLALLNGFDSCFCATSKSLFTAATVVSHGRFFVFWVSLSIILLASVVLVCLLFSPRQQNIAAAVDNKLLWRDVIWGLIPLLLLGALVAPTIWAFV